MNLPQLRVRIIMLIVITLTTAKAQNASIVSFRLDSLYNPQIHFNVECDIYGDSLIVGIMPYSVPLDSFIAVFQLSPNTILSCRGETQESGTTWNNYSTTQQYTLVDTIENTYRTYTVMLRKTGLSTVHIHTENQAPIDSKDLYVGGVISIYPNEQLSGIPLYKGDMQIKGRGNSTWSMPKKPYKIKLEKKAALLGMPSDKEWAFLANYSDKTLIRNTLAFELGKRFDLPYNPNAKNVDLFLNDRYQGTYQLTEQIKIATNRVNIRELSESDTTAAKISGGYLLEVDERMAEEYCFRTTRGVPFCIKEPGSIVPAQWAYIQEYIQKTEDAIFEERFDDPVNGYRAFIDVEKLINWYLVNEVLKNNDAVFFSSVFMYKDKDSKLSLGPVWDFDISAGNIDYNGNENPNGWWVRNAIWLNKLFEDVRFKREVKNRWNYLKANKMGTLSSFIDGATLALTVSQEENFKKWNILNTYVWPNAVVTGSYQEEVNYLKTWLNSRINWMDAEVNKAFLSPFDLSTPVDNYGVTVVANSPSIISFSWHKVDETIRYKWLLYAENSSVPLAAYETNNLGNDTILQLSQAELFQKLIAAGVKEDATLKLKWSVCAYLGEDSLFANQTFSMLITMNDNKLKPFNLLFPANNVIKQVALDSALPMKFVWNASKNALMYKLYVCNLNEETNKLRFVTLSDRMGKDTSFVLHDSILQRFFALKKFNSDTSVIKLKWAVYAYLNSNDSLISEQQNDLIIFKVDTTKLSIDLTLPTSNAILYTDADDTGSVLFNWKSTKEYDKSYYKLYCTYIDSSFSNPVYSQTSADSFLVVKKHEIDSLLMQRGIKRGDSLALKWTVFGFDHHADSTLANQQHIVTFKRSRSLIPFSILAPIGSGNVFKIENDSFPDITFEWGLAGASNGIMYKGIGTIQNKHIPNSVYTFVTHSNVGSFLLNRNEIRKFVDAADADSTTLQYVIRAYDAEDSIESSNQVAITFVKVNIVDGVMQHEQNRKAAAWVYPNPFTDKLYIQFDDGIRQNQDVNIEVSDITGRVFRTQQKKALESGGTVVEFDEKTPSGVYVIKLTTQNSSMNIKVLKQ